MLGVEFHKLRICTNSGVLINLDWDFLHPLCWCGLNNETYEKCRGTPSNTGEESLALNCSGLKEPLQIERATGGSLLLDRENDKKYSYEDPIAEETSKDVEITWTHNSAIDLVKELEEHEGIEDDCKMLLFGNRNVALV